jgi:hypothetical protein
MDGDACYVSLLASLRNVKDAAWNRGRGRIDQWKRQDADNRIGRRGD